MSQARDLSLTVHALRAARTRLVRARSVEPRGRRDGYMLSLLRDIARLDAQLVALRRAVDAGAVLRARRAAA